MNELCKKKCVSCLGSCNFGKHKIIDPQFHQTFEGQKEIIIHTTTELNYMHLILKRHNNLSLYVY